MRYIFLGFLFMPCYLWATIDYEREEIIQRIKPIGIVRVKEVPGEAEAPPKPAQEVVQKASGQVIYEQYCQVCHQTGTAGAPKFQAPEWRERLVQKKISGLTASAIKGLNAMPPKGTCTECSEEDIKAAIEYMVPQS